MVKSGVLKMPVDLTAMKVMMVTKMMVMMMASMRFRVRPQRT
jgi:hypothetical protein